MPKYQKGTLRLPQQPLYEEDEELESREPSNTSVASDDESPLRNAPSRVGALLRAPPCLTTRHRPMRGRRLTRSLWCRVTIPHVKMRFTGARSPKALPRSHTARREGGWGA
jgi:hypothetical protein